QQPQPRPQQPQPRQLQQPQAEPAEPRGQVVALVNDESITQTELKSRVEQQIQGQQVDQQTRQQVEKQALDALIQTKLVDQHLQKQGPQVEPREVEAVVENVQQQVE